MAYIDTKYLGQCETCRHHRSGGCNTYCDHREEYSPNLSKIPTADVVSRETVEQIFEEIEDCMRNFEDDDDGYLLKKCEFEYFMREIKKEYTGEQNNDR